MQISVSFIWQSIMFLVVFLFNDFGFIEWGLKERKDKKVFNFNLKCLVKSWNLRIILFLMERDRVFATISNIRMPISLQPDDVNLWHFEIIW